VSTFLEKDVYNEPRGFRWPTEEWQRLKRSAGDLSDHDFLQAFEPVLSAFRARTPHLESCARALAQYYPPPLNVLELASGCDVFPAIMRSMGYQAVGLEADSPASRYCNIHGIAVISPKNWNVPIWTEDRFDLIVLICFFTGVTENAYGRRMLARLCDNVIYQMQNGSQFLLFDKRCFEPLMSRFAKLKLTQNIRWTRHALDGITFYSLAWRSHPWWGVLITRTRLRMIREYHQLKEVALRVKSRLP
jgi:hypothetical protein